MDGVPIKLLVVNSGREAGEMLTIVSFGDDKDWIGQLHGLQIAKSLYTVHKP